MVPVSAEVLSSVSHTAAAIGPCRFQYLLRPHGLSADPATSKLVGNARCILVKGNGFALPRLFDEEVR